MKISIDTKEDSPEEIHKVINLLKSVVGCKDQHSNIFEDNEPELSSQPEPAAQQETPSSSPGMFSMFDQPAESSEQSEQPAEEDDETEEEAPEIQVY